MLLKDSVVTIILLSSIAVKRHLDQGNSDGRKYLIGAALQFHYHHCGEHGGMQADDGTIAESYNFIRRQREKESRPCMD